MMLDVFEGTANQPAWLKQKEGGREVENGM